MLNFEKKKSAKNIFEYIIHLDIYEELLKSKWVVKAIINHINKLEKQV